MRGVSGSLHWRWLVGIFVLVGWMYYMPALAQDASGSAREDTIPAVNWKYKPSKSRPYRKGEVISVMLEAAIPKGVRLYSIIDGAQQGYTPTLITFLDSTQARIAGGILEKGTPVERTDKTTRKRIRYFEHSVTFVVSFKLLNAGPKLVHGQVRYSISDERGREAIRTFDFAL
jgi:hypothetical protein